MRPSVRIAALALALAALEATTTPTPAAAAGGLFDRIRRGFASGVDLEAAALTSPIRVSADSLESEVYAFATALGREVVRVRFAGDDLARANEEISPGVRLVVIDSVPLVVDGEQVMVARKWRTKSDKDSLRAEFLATYRAQILGYALRGKPEALPRIFGAGSPALVQLGRDAVAVQHAVGYTVPEFRAEVEQADLPVVTVLTPAASPPAALEQCSCPETLREVDGVLAALAAGSCEVGTAEADLVCRRSRRARETIEAGLVAASSQSCVTRRN